MARCVAYRFFRTFWRFDTKIITCYNNPSLSFKTYEGAGAITMDYHAPHRTPISFATTVALVFVALILMLVSIDFVPERRDSVDVPSIVFAQDTVMEPVEVDEGPRSTIPVRITVGSVRIDTPVVTPESVEVEVLDRALLTGAVHYPQSALAGETGTMLLFGHSSYLPVVQNRAFQAFNELGKVKPGAEIVVHTETHTFTYTVKQVKLARAEEVTVRFEAEVPTLVLATCNTFGAKEERWVATALLTGEERIDHQGTGGFVL